LTTLEEIQNKTTLWIESMGSNQLSIQLRKQKIHCLNWVKFNEFFGIHTKESFEKSQWKLEKIVMRSLRTIWVKCRCTQNRFMQRAFSWN
jgi:hypothetical protein